MMNKCPLKDNNFYNVSNQGTSEIMLILLSDSSIFSVAPAPRRRKWIERMTIKHAYRCLPMSIASEYGWVVKNPETFSLKWDGGNITSSIDIDPNVNYVKSHFGDGIITFTFDFLVKTSNGINLWYRGLPNHFIGGAAPLEGIVESDWLPHTVTMNWKLLRTNHKIVFEKDAPLCFFTPIKRGEIEEYKLSTIKSEETGNFKKSLEVFRNSRNEFNEGLINGKIAFNQWQKFYHKGECPDGTVAPKDHQVRVVLDKFK